MVTGKREAGGEHWQDLPGQASDINTKQRQSLELVVRKMEVQYTIKDTSTNL